MKNHIRVGGKLIQTNKRFSQLKQRQKEFINSLLKEKTLQLLRKKGKLTRLDKEQILSETMSQIKEKSIWIPFREVQKYYRSRLVRYQKAFAKERES